MSNPKVLDNPVERRFRGLVAAWKAAASGSVSSSLSDFFAHPAYRQIVAMGARADYGTPQQFSDFVDAETKKFAGIIQKEGLQMDVQ